MNVSSKGVWGWNLPKRIIAVCAACIMAILLLPRPAWAAKDEKIIYVSANGVYCHYKTITEALAAATPGTTILVRDGVYNEGQIEITKSGEAGAPITIKAEKENAVLPLGQFTLNAEYIVLDGLKMDGKQGTAKYSAIVNNRPNNTIIIMDIREYAGYTVYCATARNSNVGGTNAYIAYNYAETMGAGYYLASDTVLEYNELKGVKTYDDPGLAGDFCRIFGVNIVVRGNFYHGTEAANLHLPGREDVHADFIQSWDDLGIDVANVLIEDNLAYGKYHQGIMLENDRYGPEGKLYIHDWTVRNNVFAGYNAWGICGGKAPGGIPNMHVYNNTFVADVSGGTKTWNGVGFIGVGGSGTCYNNIFVGQVSASYFAQDGATMEADNNLIYNAPAPLTPGPNDIIGSDPMFVQYDPERKEEGLLENDYRLADVSPCIDKGAVTDTNVDIDGNKRPANAAYDIGAYEFQGEPGNTAPIVLLNGVSNGSVIKEDTEQTFTVEATDPDGITRAEFYFNDELVQTCEQEPYTYTVLLEAGKHNIYAKAYDGTGLESQSAVANFYVNSEPYVDGDATWRNQSMPVQKGFFSVAFSILPLVGETNGVVGLSDGEAKAYSDMAVGVRISPTGVIDVRQPDNYYADVEVPYEPGMYYQFRMDIDVSAQLYDVYVTPEDGETVKLASGYRFRATPDQLNNWFTYAESGATKVFSFQLVSGSGEENESGDKVITLQIGNPEMKVGGLGLEIDPGYGTAPELMDGVTMLPVRALVEQMGGLVEWDPAEQNIYIEVGEQIVEMWVGRNTALVNGETVPLETPPVIVGVRTLVPLRFVGEMLGATVDWEESTQTVTLTIAKATA